MARLPSGYSSIVVEMNIKVALSHFCCRTTDATVQSDSVSVSSQAGDSSSLVDSMKHIVIGSSTCDQQVAGSNPGRRVVECNPGQVVYTRVPLSPSSIIWYQR